MAACDIDTADRLAGTGTACHRDNGRGSLFHVMVCTIAPLSHCPLGRVIRYGLVIITGLGLLTACDPRRAQSDLSSAGNAATRLSHSK